MCTHLQTVLSLSGRTLTTAQALALCGPSPAGSSPKRLHELCIDRGEVEGNRPPQPGDLRLMATLDAEGRVPGLYGGNAARHCGAVTASIFDGACWQRFDIAAMCGPQSFSNPSGLDILLRSVRKAAAAAAGRAVSPHSVGGSSFPRYGLEKTVRNLAG